MFKSSSKIPKAIANALTEEERTELYEKALRWWLGELKADFAVRKVRVDEEIAAHYRTK